jgi:hypothetical protein
MEMIKLRRMKWMEHIHVLCMGEQRSAYTFWSENVKERDQVTELHIDGRVILKWILKKDDGRVCTGFSLVQSSEQWEAFVGTVMNFWVP